MARRAQDLVANAAVQDLAWLVQHYGEVTVGRSPKTPTGAVYAQCPVWGGAHREWSDTEAGAIQQLYSAMRLTDARPATPYVEPAS